MRIYLHLCLLLIASSCAPKLTQTSSSVEKDSTSVKVVHHHDTIRIKGEIITIIQKKLIHDTVIVEKQGRTELDITRKNGITTTICKSDSLQKALDIALNDTTRYKFKTTKVVRTIYQNKPKSDLTKFCEWFTIIVIAACLGFTVYKFRKVVPFLS